MHLIIRKTLMLLYFVSYTGVEGCSISRKWVDGCFGNYFSISIVLVVLNLKVCAWDLFDWQVILFQIGEMISRFEKKGFYLKGKSLDKCLMVYQTLLWFVRAT